MKNSYLAGIIKQFEYYKLLGDKTFEQLSSTDIHWQYNASSNSVAIIVKHMSGNMLSRWTHFLSEDGEKSWRNRDTEFENPPKSKTEILEVWNTGWNCLFNAIMPLKNSDLERIIYIRNEGHTVTEAINRQLCHYAYHVGQIVYVGKLIKAEQWTSLSIPKKQSELYNTNKFSKTKTKRHFTDGEL